MIVLKTGSLTPTGERLQVASLKIDLSERASQCAGTVIGGTPLQVGTWIKGQSGPGAGIVWRIKTVDDSRAGSGTWSFTAEHIVRALTDQILFGETKSQDMGGNKNTVSAASAMSYILGKSDCWRYGGCAYSDSNPYQFNGENLFAALETITSSLEDCYWDYDLTVFPFKLYFRRLSDDVDSEMRISRNITGTIKKTIDRTGMYTRIYPVGKNNLTLPEKSLSRNVGTWGLVEKTETDQSLDTVAKLRSWGNERLRDHCNPIVSVTIPGLDLSSSTGESLDRIRLNRVCRVPLPEYNTTIKEKVTKITWADAVKEPEVFTVVLCNQVQDVASIIRQMASSSGKSGRAAAKKGEEDLAWFEDTEEHVSMVAVALLGPDEDGVDWRRISDITADGEGLHQSVKKMQGDVLRQEARIDITENSINQTVTAIGKDGKITAGSICLAINDSGEPTATINAKKIYLLGQTIAEYVTADFIQSRVNLMNALRVKQLTVANSLYFESGGATITGSLAADIFTGLKVVSAGNNNYKLQALRVGAQSWTDLPNSTFSRAVSSWTWAGGGGKVSVTAKPQDQTKSVNISVSGNSRITGNGSFTYTADYENMDGDDVSTGATKTVVVAVAPKDVERKSSGITGTNLGNFASVSGKYITFTVGGDSYYLQIAS